MDNIWKKLSAIDVSAKIEKKGRLNYLSWAWAWGELMDNYPSATYSFLPNEYHVDDSVTVHCTLTVEGLTRSMWLPVMDNKNNSVSNPTSRQISDTKMRCLTKCIAMFGLGHNIYAGEDINTGDAPVTQFSQDDDKPWYNEFDSHKGKMVEKITSGQATAKDILSNLRKTFKVNKKIAGQIESLELNGEEAPF